MLSEITSYIEESSQLIEVKAETWDRPHAEMQWWITDDITEEWITQGRAFDVTVGKNGLAWGQNLMPLPAEASDLKKEGDHKTPAGLYGLCFAFGYSPEPAPGMAWPYLPLGETFVGVDDPKSRYYNCIVDSAKLQPQDWNSAETMMREDGQYKWGMVVDYNFVNMQPGTGSQIFLHIWRGPGLGTEGCIAMPEANMLELLQWLDGSKNALLWIH